MAEIDDVLTADEHVLWEGRPAVLPFFAGTILGILLGAPLLVVAIRSFTSSLSSPASNVVGAALLLLPIALIGLALAVALPLLRILRYLCITYAVTTRRVILRSGIIERTVAMVDFDQIGSASVEIAYDDVFLALGLTGSLTLRTRTTCPPHDGETAPDHYVLSHVFRPYRLLTLFERAQYDVKTDIEYPNELRPESNPGYGTAYQKERL